MAMGGIFSRSGDYSDSDDDSSLDFDDLEAQEIDFAQNLEDSSSEEEVLSKFGASRSSSPDSDLSVMDGTSTADALHVHNEDNYNNDWKVAVDDIKLLDSELDLYEKVSFIFLVYDDPKVGLKKAQSLFKSNSHIMTDWWLEQRGNAKWPEILTEALCIIQNYNIIRVIRSVPENDRDNLRKRFLPQHPFTSVHVSRFRKILYFICEQLLPDEVQDLIKSVQSELESELRSGKNYDSFQVLDHDYLELSFLYWETLNFIRVNEVSRIRKILKRMGKLEECELLEKIKEPSKPEQKHLTDFKDSKILKLLEDGTSFHEFVTEIENVNVVDDSNKTVTREQDVARYYMDQKHPGICLIINQEYFYNETGYSTRDLEHRTGTGVDLKALCQTFKHFNFKIKVHNNLTHEEILEAISKTITRITKESSLFVCILSHGSKDVVYGTNCHEVRVPQIEEMMTSLNPKNMSGKPKILILQACQGQNLLTVDSAGDEQLLETDSPFVRGSPVDLFTFWATYSGYAAIRNKSDGSWFIQSLCQHIMKLGTKMHFEDLCTEVTRDVTSKKGTVCKQKHKGMVPIRASTLTKRLYLPPIVS